MRESCRGLRLATGFRRKEELLQRLEACLLPTDEDPDVLDDGEEAASHGLGEEQLLALAREGKLDTLSVVVLRESCRSLGLGMTPGLGCVQGAL